jgi:hypothetical protein
VTITYYLSDGTTHTKDLSVGAHRRRTVAVHEEGEGVGRGKEVAARVTTTAPGGIVVERPIYFTYNGGVTGIVGGHDAMGATAPARAWRLAEGYTGAGFDQYITILNPGAAPAPVTITYYLSDGATQTREVTVGASRRATVAVHGAAEGVGRGRSVAAVVTTTSAAGIVVERPMYFRYGAGVTGGHVVMGASAP